MKSCYEPRSHESDSLGEPVEAEVVVKREEREGVKGAVKWRTYLLYLKGMGYVYGCVLGRHGRRLHHPHHQHQHLPASVDRVPSRSVQSPLWSIFRWLRRSSNRIPVFIQCRHSLRITSTLIH